jgi:hypothetical protein
MPLHSPALKGARRWFAKRWRRRRRRRRAAPAKGTEYSGRRRQKPGRGFEEIHSEDATSRIDEAVQE